MLLRTGIPAVMWPCGVIMHISELFMAESKTQFYGQLHDLLNFGHILAQRNN